MIYRCILFCSALFFEIGMTVPAAAPVTQKWAQALQNAGVRHAIVARFCALRASVEKHQELLALDGIGVEVSERDRVRVNARRVGLEAPLFADEAESAGFEGFDFKDPQEKK